jgi:hypothetical protein
MCDFPSCVLGNLKLIIRISPDALVWCSVDPQQSIKQMSESYPFVQDPAAEMFNYKRASELMGSNHINHNYDH